jgi:hypothetical protein
MKEKNESEILLGIQKRLDVLISLTINRELKEDKSVTKKQIINALSSLGLKYTEIAAIFGKSPSYIASELSIAKKGGR